jgi:hypothetical protein
MEYTARHEQPHKPPGHLDQLRMRGEGLPEGPARLQYEDFLRRVDALLADLGFESIEAFVKGAKGTKKNLEALPYLQALLRKLNEIYATKERVTDDFEYAVDVSAYEGVEKMMLVQGEMILIVKTTEGSVLLDQWGNTVLENFDCASFVVHEREGEWFAEAVLNSGEKVLVSSKGGVIAKGYKNAWCVDWPGDVAFKIEIDHWSVNYITAIGEPLIDEKQYKHTPQVFADENETFHCYQNKRTHQFQIFDGKGQEIGREYWDLGLLTEPGCWYIGYAKTDRSFILVDREGSETPFNKPFEKVIAVGERGARLYGSHADELYVYNEKEELVFGPDHIEGFTLKRVKSAVRQGEKTYFVVQLEENKSTFGTKRDFELVLDENGEHVSFASRDLINCLAKSIKVPLFGKDRIYFGMDYGESCEVVDNTGRTYDGSYDKLEAFAEIGGDLYVQETFKDGSWKIKRDRDGEVVFQSDSRAMKPKTLHQVEGRFYIIAQMSGIQYLFPGKDIVALLIGDHISVQRKGDAVFALANPEGVHSTICDLKTEMKTRSYLHMKPNPVIVGENIYFVASDHGDHYTEFLDQTGAVYEVPGELYDIAPLSDTQILVVYKEDGVLHKKPFEVL